MSDYHHSVEVVEINDGTRNLDGISSGRWHGLHGQRC